MPFGRSKSSQQELSVIDILSALADSKTRLQIQTKDGTYVFEARYRTEIEKKSLAATNASSTTSIATSIISSATASAPASVHSSDAARNDIPCNRSTSAPLTRANSTSSSVYSQTWSADFSSVQSVSTSTATIPGPTPAETYKFGTPR